MDQAFSVLQEALCETLCSLHAKMTLQAMEGSSDSANVTESRVLRFPQILQSPERWQTDGVHCAWMRIDDREL